MIVESRINLLSIDHPLDIIEVLNDSEGSILAKKQLRAMIEYLQVLNQRIGRSISIR